MNLGVNLFQLFKLIMIFLIMPFTTQRWDDVYFTDITETLESFRLNASYYLYVDG